MPMRAEELRNAKGYYRIYICGDRYRAVYRVFKSDLIITILTDCSGRKNFLGV